MFLTMTMNIYKDDENLFIRIVKDSKQNIKLLFYFVFNFVNFAIDFFFIDSFAYTKTRFTYCYFS